jgi:sugar lactone lactonase YvrE
VITTLAVVGAAGVANDSAGNVYIADGTSHIFKVSNNVITVVAGNGTVGFSGDNGPATSAQLNSPYQVAVDATGNLYIADTGNGRVRKVSSGVISTVAGGSAYGDNGPATSAQVVNLAAVAVDSVGNIYIADSGNARIREVSNGIITTVAGGGSVLGDNGPATSALLNYSAGVAVDGSGNIYIADSSSNRIRKVSSGIITTVAGMGAAGFSGDSGPATSARLNHAQGVAVDSAGNLYIADTASNRVRQVSNGVITTVAGNGTAGSGGDNGSATSAQLNSPTGVAVDSAGNLYIAEFGGNRIRKVSNGVITTVAGNGISGFHGDNGPATNAQLRSPRGVAIDALNNIYIGDLNNHRIRKVSNGVITTVAGNGTVGFSGDNGPATSATLSSVAGVAVDLNGNVYFADATSNRTRVMTPLAVSK